MFCFVWDSGFADWIGTRVMRVFEGIEKRRNSGVFEIRGKDELAG
jgi:hypothetical protein